METTTRLPRPEADTVAESALALPKKAAREDGLAGAARRPATATDWAAETVNMSSSSLFCGKGRKDAATHLRSFGKPNGLDIGLATALAGPK